ncbi:MAG: DNA-directed RNA polymerase subunit A' [Candidatus Methylarchaceae archaeon HK02M1]|nr:DNA-directed RNA polymerase subunit A' [Candidatus Methylarchaceae archaeon HK02M1]
MYLEESVKTIDSIKFTVFSPNQIRKYSVAEITTPETYDEDGIPIQGGLMDNRLGTLEPGQKCATCGNTTARCPGHYGHIELAEPVLHIAFVKVIYKLLLSICRVCGRLLISEAELESYRKRFTNECTFTPKCKEEIPKEMMAKAKKIKICPHCGKQQYEIEFTKPTIFHEITEEGGAIRLLPIAIRERFERIPDIDLKLLGFDPRSARPEWFILQVLPVPPLSVRPSITLESGIRSEDDLTHKLVDILRVNQRVRESKASGTPPLIVQDLVDLLQYHVTTYFDNEVSGIPQAHHRSGRPLKTISQRLKGKEGRFRGSLSGKRVDFSSRTVISPDPSLDISEVGVPLEVAKKVTVAEKVSSWNQGFLKNLVINGPSKYPGANYIIRPDGVKIRLDYVSDKETFANTLAPGFVVERHLMNGDIVIFNRQPSLHRMSIMAHYVKVLPFRTFRLHPAVCPPYNADFDGDEMNLHVPQSEEARSEALTLMKVQQQILSPRYGGPIIGAIRDFITAAYLLTKPETLLIKEEFSNLALAGGYDGPLPKPEINEPRELYTGIQLFSLFLPKDFNYTMTSKWTKSSGKGASVRDIMIKDGKLLSGSIDRAAIGAEEPDSVLHRIAKDYGIDVARNFLNSILSILKSFITKYGFSYGYDGLILDEEAKKMIDNEIKNSYRKIKESIDQFNQGTLKTVRGLSLEETLEFYIVNELAGARDRVGRTADKAFPLDNSGVVMARTGARGSSLNIGQMTAALGQQSVRGKRIEKGYHGRALSHFSLWDRTPDAKGFIRSNYRDGLNPTEFFFHAIGGREGLVDTAVRTQQSGYMQRRLINALEHLKVEYDLTVRDPFGNIVEFLYGEDGVDPAKSDHGKAVNVEHLVEIEALVNKSEKPVEEKQLEKILNKYEGQLNIKLIQDLKASLLKIPLNVSGNKNVCRKVVEQLDRATIEPGEACGVVAAQSIGEPGTQMTLRTFHFAGVKERDVTLGLPRLIELVDARKQPSTPSMDIYLDDEHRSSEESALKIAKEILLTRVSDLVGYSEISYGERGYEINLFLDQEALQERDSSPEQIVKAISLKSGKRKVEVDEEGAISVTMEGADFSTLSVLKDKIMSMRVKGVPGIDHITIIKKGDEWMMQTAGSNLAKVLKIPGVDRSRTTTNNIYEIETALGIEAARAAHIKEIMSTLDEQGLEVDIRHILLVADLMTSKGFFQSIGRHGIAGQKPSVLARAAFEITVPTLVEASVKGEVEELKGVTENVIVGLPIPVGTGMIDLFMKSDKSD